VKIAFAGKGGSGKTTLSSMFVRHLASRGLPVVAIDADINHLIDSAGEYVVVDCAAGADSFASGLFTRFDLTVLVAEPTRKGISVYKQWQGYSGGFDVPVALVGNKVQTPGDAAFLRSHAGEEPLALIGHESAVRAMEQGRPFSLDDLSPGTAAALSAIQSRLDAAPRDWDRYTRLAAEFHRRNARAWASDKAGEDLAAQIDPDFTLGPHALAPAATGTGYR